MPGTEPLEPELVAALQAIDATLDGEPVEPEFAELAELSLILRDQAPRPDEAVLERLDDRMRTRFADPPARSRTTRQSRWRGAWGRGGAAVAALTAVIVLIVVQPWSGGDNQTVHFLSAPSSSSGSAASGAGGAGSSGGTSASSAESGSATATSRAPAPAVPAPAPVAPTSARHQIAQTARLQLRARAGRISQVSRALFRVIATERGSVTRSRVNAEADGPSEATFELRVPSGRLQATLTRLSGLRGARVLSRTDSSQEITAQIGGAATRLADARALRRSLLSRLAAATTQPEADRLTVQLHRNEVAIGRAAAALARLHGRVSDSTIAVQITAPAPVRHRRHHAAGGGFTLHRALHDAGHILLVALGVLVIGVAVLIPLSLLAVFAAWLWSRVLRRRREGALGA
jgi:hypothetical protein